MAKIEAKSDGKSESDQRLHRLHLAQKFIGDCHEGLFYDPDFGEACAFSPDNLATEGVFFERDDGTKYGVFIQNSVTQDSLAILKYFKDSKKGGFIREEIWVAVTYEEKTEDLDPSLPAERGKAIRGEWRFEKRLPIILEKMFDKKGADEISRFLQENFPAPLS